MEPKELFYNQIADRFDAVMNQYDLERRLDIVFDDLLGGETLAGQMLLDVGCGTGWFTQLAANRLARVVALDVGLRLLEKTREKSNAALVAGDACCLPFADGTFDFILSSECIEHTHDPLGAVHEMCRVLKPGGVLVLTVPNKVWRLSAIIARVLNLRPYDGFENWVSRRDLRRAMRANGMRILQMSGFHLFPPVLAVTWPILRYADRYGGLIGPAMLNVAVKAVK